MVVPAWLKLDRVKRNFRVSLPAPVESDSITRTRWETKQQHTEQKRDDERMIKVKLKGAARARPRHARISRPRKLALAAVAWNLALGVAAELVDPTYKSALRFLSRALVNLVPCGVHASSTRHVGPSHACSILMPARVVHRIGFCVSAAVPRRSAAAFVLGLSPHVGVAVA